jgi:hypothetical protein
MRKIDWVAVGFWMFFIALVLYRIAETQEDILKETRIHTAYIRGAVPIAENHDACGH